eukprot:2547474-Pleurochrysis_carterae.AAC.1
MPVGLTRPRRERQSEAQDSLHYVGKEGGVLQHSGLLSLVIPVSALKVDCFVTQLERREPDQHASEYPRHEKVALHVVDDGGEGGVELWYVPLLRQEAVGHPAVADEHPPLVRVQRAR